jgi:hypothetical protein
MSFLRYAHETQIELPELRQANQLLRLMIRAAMFYYALLRCNNENAPLIC